MSTVYVSQTGRHSAYKEFFPFDLYEIATRSKRAVFRDGQCHTTRQESYKILVAFQACSILFCFNRQFFSDFPNGRCYKRCIARVI